MRSSSHPVPARRVQRARRLVGLERHYRCEACGSERRSWARIQSCASCGTHLSFAVIRRAALA